MNNFYITCRIPNHVGDCCMALPGLRLLEASGLTPVLTGKRWAEDLLAGTGWRFEPIEGHVTEDLDRILHVVGEDIPKGSSSPTHLVLLFFIVSGGFAVRDFPQIFAVFC